MPKRANRSACVPELIIQPNGDISTVMLDERYRPYTAQEARVENLCGCFTEKVYTEMVKGALVTTNCNFGRQKEVFNIHGNVAINKGKGLFMGVRDMNAIEKLADAIGLSSSHNNVHMAVICGKIGTRLQVKTSGLLENRLHRFPKNLLVEGRQYEHTNTVRIRVRKFSDEGVFDLEEQYRPQKNDWSITGRGTVMIRFTWSKIEWTKDCETACLKVCNSIIQNCIRLTVPPEETMHA